MNFFKGAIIKWKIVDKGYTSSKKEVGKQSKEIRNMKIESTII